MRAGVISGRREPIAGRGLSGLFSYPPGSSRRLTPSVVSHHISQLEIQLGVALIYRSTHSLSLTRDGERLLLATRQT